MVGVGLGLQLREMIVYYLVPWGTGGKSESVSSENSGMAAAVLSPGGVFVEKEKKTYIHMCVCVCVFFPSILDMKFVGRTSRGHTGGRSHRIFNPPSFCGACLDFCREKDSAFPFPRRP